MARLRASPNFRTQELIKMAQDMGTSPFEILMRFAMNDFEWLGYDEHQTKFTQSGAEYEELTISPELRAQCAEKAASYIYPKLKAIEHTGDADNRPPVVITKEAVLAAIKNDPFLNGGMDASVGSGPTQDSTISSGDRSGEGKEPL